MWLCAVRGACCYHARAGLFVRPWTPACGSGSRPRGDSIPEGAAFSPPSEAGVHGSASAPTPPGPVVPVRGGEMVSGTQCGSVPCGARAVITREPAYSFVPGLQPAAPALVHAATAFRAAIAMQGLTLAVPRMSLLATEPSLSIR